MDGLQWKTLLKNWWFGGTPIFGNIDIVHTHCSKDSLLQKHQNITPKGSFLIIRESSQMWSPGIQILPLGKHPGTRRMR